MGLMPNAEIVDARMYKGKGAYQLHMRGTVPNNIHDRRNAQWAAGSGELVANRATEAPPLPTRHTTHGKTPDRES